MAIYNPELYERMDEDSAMLNQVLDNIRDADDAVTTTNSSGPIWWTDGSGSVPEQTFERGILTNEPHPVNIELGQFNNLSKADLDYTNNELRKVDDRVSKLEGKIDKMIENQEELIKMLDYLVERKAKAKNLQYGLRG